MAKFKIKITETNVGYFFVEAEDWDEAIDLGQESYDNGDFLLDGDTVAIGEGGVEVDAEEVIK